VRHLGFSNPLHPVDLPFATRLLALPGVIAQRRLPIRLSLTASYWTSGLRVLRHPQQRDHVARAIRLVAGKPLDERTLSRYVRRAISLRRMGFRTYGPVSGRTRQWLLRSLQVEGLEQLDGLKAASQGAIVLGAHVGLDGWVGPVLRGLGYPVKLIQRRGGGPQMYLLLKRDRLLDEVLPYPDEVGSGPHLKMLHDMVLSGCWVIHVADVHDPRGLPGAFFGHEVRCCRAPWALARLTGAPAVPVVLLADERMKVRMTVGPLLRVPQDVPAHPAMGQAFQAYLDFLTSQVCPVPWNVSRTYWLPSGEPAETGT
jgi:lauroyl/myristoyl acyltransferase